MESIIKVMLKIDAVIRNTGLSQIKARLEQAGIQNYSIHEMNSGNCPLFCVPRSQIEIICKTSQKDAALQAISGADEQGGLIYVNQLATLINLNSTSSWWTQYLTCLPTKQLSQRLLLILFIANSICFLSNLPCCMVFKSRSESICSNSFLHPHSLHWHCIMICIINGLKTIP